MTTDTFQRRASPPASHTGRQALTPREAEILTLLCRGHSAQQMSRTLGIAVATVRKHLEHTYAKLGTHDRVSAVLVAQRLGVDG